MAPLVVQLTAWAVLFLAGRLGVLPTAATPVGALRLAMAAMFAFTALSHFLPRTRPALVRMVPPALPTPGLLVTTTGLLELAGAVGLLVPSLDTASTSVRRQRPRLGNARQSGTLTHRDAGLVVHHVPGRRASRGQ